jgi:hypothetical protein
VRFTPLPLYPLGKSPLYTLDRRLGGPQNLSGRSGEEKNRTQTVQLVAPRYTDSRLKKFIIIIIIIVIVTIRSGLGWIGRSQWSRGQRLELSSLARTLGSWVRIPLKAWMSGCAFIFYVCVALSVGSGIASG